MFGLNSMKCFFNGGPEFIGVERFHQVIQGAVPESLYCKFAMCGSKNDPEIHGGDPVQKIEAGFATHLYVKKHKLGFACLNSFGGSHYGVGFLDIHSGKVIGK